jgi:hypothetical protein
VGQAKPGAWFPIRSMVRLLIEPSSGQRQRRWRMGVVRQGGRTAPLSQRVGSTARPGARANQACRGEPAESRQHLQPNVCEQCASHSRTHGRSQRTWHPQHARRGKRRMFIQNSVSRIMRRSPFGHVCLAVDEPKGDPAQNE